MNMWVKMYTCMYVYTWELVSNTVENPWNFAGREGGSMMIPVFNEINIQ